MNLAHKEVEISGKTIKFFYPDVGETGWLVSNILSGNSYPFLEIDYTPEVIIDIGANIGATALFFAKCYPNVPCFCFEPSKKSFDILRINTNVISQIKSFCYGLSDHPRLTKLYLGQSQCLQNSLYNSNEVTDNFEEVEIRSAAKELGKIMTKSCILKIDTEGSELPIICSIIHLIDKVDILCLEYHSETDRRKIDLLLSPNYSLWFSQSSSVHRGNLGYISYRMLMEFPHLDRREIKIDRDTLNNPNFSS